MARTQNSTLWRDGEGDVFEKHWENEDGSWYGRWVELDGQPNHDAMRCTLPLNYMQVVGMNPMDEGTFDFDQW